MKTVFNEMKKKKSGVPAHILPIFAKIIHKHDIGAPSLPPECEDEFYKAMEQHLTETQRFNIYAQAGGCKGIGADKERLAFAKTHAHLPLNERIQKFNELFNRNIDYLDEQTMAVHFKCHHGYYLRAREGKDFNLPGSIKSYFERCAGGRLYEYEKALGVNLRIKAVDISPLIQCKQNPVLFIFEIK